MGVTLGVLQNDDGWWGEGDEMIFVDDEAKPLDQWHRIGRLFPGKLGFRRTRSARHLRMSFMARR